MQLFDAIEAGDVETVRSLVARDPALADSAAVLLAKYRWEHEIAGLLVATGRPLDVFAASAVEQPERVRELLGEDPSLVGARTADGFTALHLAAYFGGTGCARLLVAAGADVEAIAGNPTLVRPLHSAVAGRDAEIVRILLDAGADPAAEQQGGHTPLSAAEQNADEVVARMLREAMAAR